MLDHLKLMRAIEQKIAVLSHPLDNQLQSANQWWQAILSKDFLDQKKAYRSIEKNIPDWHEHLATKVPIVPYEKPYRVIGIDGSQIYPDRHLNMHCALINIGAVTLTYADRSAMSAASIPTICAQDDLDIPLTADLVNVLRQEYELAYAVDLPLYDDAVPTIFLFDGALICWHLSAYEPSFRTFFIQRYQRLLHKLYEQGKIVAWYTSLPASKEVMTLVRYAACDYQGTDCQVAQQIDRVTDADLMHNFLDMHERSVVFDHQSSVTTTTAEPLCPSFFYLKLAQETVRIEVPRWIAASDSTIALISSCIVDQAVKGYGYPVCLAEAHEQAVVKSADRELFYHLLNKYTQSSKKHFSISQKSSKKRRMSV